MSDRSGIEWCDATWNPIRGCSRVSAGCERCYAERVAARFSGPGQPYEGVARKAHPLGWVGPRWTGEVRFVPEKLDQPLRWKRPRRIFVASMSDPFHVGFAEEDVDSIFAAMALADWHTFQLLSKRPERMRAYVSDPSRPFRVLRAIDRIEVDRAMRGVAEEWRPVPSCPLYEVSNHGRVRRGARVLALVSHSRGYRQVALCENGKPRTALVHRLVLEAFDRSPRDGEEVAHRNGDRTDNRLANLRWATKDENMQDAARQGTAGVWMKGRATLSADEVSDIRSARARGEKLATIATRYGIDKRQISAIARGVIFKPAALPWPLPNVHLGVSIEDQATADERIPLLLQAPAAVRWVSAEPLLAPVSFRWAKWQPISRTATTNHLDGLRTLDWVVCGGESGPGARPCDVSWIRSIVEQCRDARVACYVKQAGAHSIARDEEDLSEDVLRDIVADEDGPGVGPIEWPLRVPFRDRKGSDPKEWSEDLRVREFPS